MKDRPKCYVCDRPAHFEYPIGTMVMFLCIQCENRKLYTAYSQQKEKELITPQPQS